MEEERRRKKKKEVDEEGEVKDGSISWGHFVGAFRGSIKGFRAQPLGKPIRTRKIIPA